MDRDTQSVSDELEPAWLRLYGVENPDSGWRDATETVKEES